MPPGVDKLSLRVVDRAGKEVWKTTTGANDVYVLIPDGKKVKGVFAGHASGVGETPKAAGFISISPVDVTLDLVGQNGLGAHRGITPGKAFDPEQTIKLDPRETSFGVEVKLKDANVTVKTAAKVEAGRYYLVSTHRREGFRLLSLGYMPRPAPAKKK